MHAQFRLHMRQICACAVQGYHEAKGCMCSSCLSWDTRMNVQFRFIMMHLDAVQGSHEAQRRMYISELSWGSRSHVQFMVLLKHKHKDAYIYTVQRYQVPMKHMGICACQGSHEAQGSCAYRKCNAYTGQCFTIWKTPDTVKNLLNNHRYVCESYQLLWRLSSQRLTNSHTANGTILHATIISHSDIQYQLSQLSDEREKSTCNDLRDIWRTRTDRSQGSAVE